RYEQEALLAVKESHNDFYRTMLDDLEGDTELYADDDPEIQQLEGKLGVYTKLLFDIRQDLQPRMPEALKGAGVTESTLFFGAYAYLLRLLSGQKKVLVFAGENGRNDAALADTFGMMVHNIPVLVDV
ncbi:MAG: hypothetical protein RR661_08240, partial [Anaerovoracaceae bacterium]